jgi:hypothetical protein
MIIWRDGKAGFVGAAKRFIKGFFSPVYSKTSVAVIPPDKTFGVLSIIQDRGLGVNSLMTVSLGVSSGMDSSNGLLSVIQSRGLGVSSSINNSQGVDSTL